MRFFIEENKLLFMGHKEIWDDNFKNTIEYIQKHSDNGEKGKGKTLGQKEVEQMMGTREMSDEERKQSRKKNKKEMKGPDDTHRNIT